VLTHRAVLLECADRRRVRRMSVHGVANGRVQRVLEDLAKHPQGVTVRELIIQTEPGCKLANMASSLTAMINAGCIERVGEWGSSVFRMKPAVIEAAPASPSAGTPAAPQPKPAPKARATRSVQSTVAKASPKPPAIPVSGAAPFNEPSIATGNPSRSRRDCPVTSEELAAHVAANLANGGEIERLRTRATSHPLTTNPPRAANDAA
jgi:hypothetical protein